MHCIIAAARLNAGFRVLIRVKTKYVNPVSRTEVVLIAGPTASGKSALALELAESLRRHGHQCQFDAGLSRPAHHHRAAVAGGRSACAAPALRPCRCRRELFRGPLVHRGRRGARGGEAANAAPPSSPAAPGSISMRSRAGACRGAADPRRNSRRSAGAARERGRRRAACRVCARDPAAAARLRPGDSARVTRALEVVLATGRSLLDWHGDNKPPDRRSCRRGQGLSDAGSR